MTVRVEYFGRAEAVDRLIQSLDTEVGFQRVRDAPGQDLAGMPVYDRHQIQEAPSHWQVGDVCGPDLVGPIDAQPLQQVGIRLVASERIATQKSFYVEISRARHEAILLTDDPDRLSRQIETQTGIRPTALDTWMDGRLAGARQRAAEPEKPIDPPQEKPVLQTQKEDRKPELDTPILPGLLDDKIKSFEKQAELIMQRNKEIVR